MNKYIIKNCGNRDFCACSSVRNEDCLYKRIVVLCKNNQSYCTEECDLRNLRDDILELFEIEEVK